MEPVTSESAEVMRLFEYGRNRQKIVEHDWEPGCLLVIDNWRVLHGRGNREAADPSRKMMRAYIK